MSYSKKLTNVNSIKDLPISGQRFGDSKNEEIKMDNNYHKLVNYPVITLLFSFFFYTLKSYPETI